jgi:uncharacterized protein YdgA (DUF945 family)
MAILGMATHRVGGLRPSSNPLDTPCHKLMVRVFVQEKRFSFFSKESDLAEDSYEQGVESVVLAAVAFFYAKPFFLQKTNFSLKNQEKRVFLTKIKEN